MSETNSSQQLPFYTQAMIRIGSMAQWPDTQIGTTSLMSEIIPYLCQVPFDYLYRDDPVSMAECTLLLQEYLDIDMVFANLDIYNLEGEAMGAKIKFFPDHCPDYDRSIPFIKDEEDFDRIKFHGLDSGRFPYLIDNSLAFKRFTGIDHFPQFSAPWTLASNLMGLEELVTNALMEPEMVEEFLRRIVDDFQIPMLKEISTKIDGFTQLTMADAYGSVPMVTLDIIDELIRPNLEHEMEALGMPEVKLFDTSYFGESLLKTQEERDRYHDFTIWANQWYLCIDPDLENLGIEYARKVATDKQTVLFVGIGAKTLLNNTPGQIAMRVREILLGAKKGPTPAVLLLNDLPTNAPLENIFAATHAARVFGAPDADENTPYTPAEFIPFNEFIRYKQKNNPEGFEFKWLEKSTMNI